MSVRDKQKRKPTVAIEEATYQKAKNKAKEKGLSLVDYVNETLLFNVEKDNFLKNYAPYIEKISVGETLVLKDHKTGKLAEVYLKNNKMSCSQDETDDCIHIRFALALPELALLKKRNK